jgi:hypothetical protein
MGPVLTLGAVALETPLSDVPGRVLKAAESDASERFEYERFSEDLADPASPPDARAWFELIPGDPTPLEPTEPFAALL